jgi:hypothetical protein
MPQYAAGQLAGPREAESSKDAYPPGLAPRACRRAAPAASWQQGLPGTLLGAVTHAYRGQLAEVEAWLLSTGGPNRGPLTSRQTARAAAIITTVQPPTIMTATTSALPARIDPSAQPCNGHTRYLPDAYRPSGIDSPESSPPAELRPK